MSVIAGIVIFCCGMCAGIFLTALCNAASDSDKDKYDYES